MFILLPYQHDRMSVKRLPWVSIAILALNLLAFLLTRGAATEAQERAEKALDAVYSYWAANPFVKTTPAFDERYPKPVSNLRRVVGSALEPPDPEVLAAQQRRVRAADRRHHRRRRFGTVRPLGIRPRPPEDRVPDHEPVPPRRLAAPARQHALSLSLRPLHREHLGTGRLPALLPGRGRRGRLDPGAALPRRHGAARRRLGGDRGGHGRLPGLPREHPDPLLLGLDDHQRALGDLPRAGLADAADLARVAARQRERGRRRSRSRVLGAYRRLSSSAPWPRRASSTRVWRGAICAPRSKRRSPSTAMPESTGASNCSRREVSRRPGPSSRAALATHPASAEAHDGAFQAAQLHGRHGRRRPACDERCSKGT